MMVNPVIPLLVIGAGIAALFWPDKKETENDTISENGDSGGGGDHPCEPDPTRTPDGPRGLEPKNRRKTVAKTAEERKQENVGLEPSKMVDNGGGVAGDNQGGEHGPGAPADSPPASVTPEKQRAEPLPKKKPRTKAEKPKGK